MQKHYKFQVVTNDVKRIGKARNAMVIGDYIHIFADDGGRWDYFHRDDMCAFRDAYEIVGEPDLPGWVTETVLGR